MKNDSISEALVRMERRAEIAMKHIKENTDPEKIEGWERAVEHYTCAAESIKEIQQYQAIGTVDECREARERQERKKPNGRYKTRYIWDSAYCPVCGCGITARWNFCQSCGQAIDWSE